MADRKCPDCGERLSFDALRCACGWGVRKGEKPGRFYDMRCTYQAGERCNYPVGLFLEGNTTGWCVFHRQSLRAGDGALIVAQSSRVPYAEAIRVLIEKGCSSPSVVDTAHDIAKHHGRKPWQAGNAKTFSDAVRGDSKEAA